MRSKIIAVAGVAALLVAAVAPASYAGTRPATNSGNSNTLLPLNMMGQGYSDLTVPNFSATYADSDCAKIANLVCNSGDACQCISGTSQVGEGKCSETTTETITLYLVIDTSKDFNSGTSRLCFPAGGNGKITNPPKGGEIDFDTNGLACNSASWAATYSGSYVITGGTGPYSGAQGAGTVVLGLQLTGPDPSTGTASGADNQALIAGSLTLPND